MVHMPGTVYDAVFELGADNYGFVTQTQARELGIPAQRLVALEDRDLLERRRQGLYREATVRAASCRHSTRCTTVISTPLRSRLTRGYRS